MPDLGELAYGIGGVDTFSKLGVPVPPGDGAGLPSNCPPGACKKYQGFKSFFSQVYDKLKNVIKAIIEAILH